MGSWKFGVRSAKFSRVPIYWVLGLALAMLTGCTATLTRGELEDLQRQQIGWSLPPDWQYRGSDEHYDYFVALNSITLSGSRAEYYRMPVNESAVDQRFPLTNQQNQWRSGWIIFSEPEDPNRIDFFGPIESIDLP